MNLTVLADCGINPFCHAAHLISSVAGDAAGSAVDALAKAVSDAVGDAVKDVGTLWIQVKTPQLAADPNTGAPGQTVSFLQSSLSWYAAAAAVIAVLIGGTKMALERDGRPGRELLKAMLTMSVVSGTGLAIVALSVAASDQFSAWIIDNSVSGSDFGENLTAMLGLSAAAGPGGALPAVLVIILGLIALLASLFQIALMVIRGGMLVILAGVLPLSASFTNTELGRAWFRRCVSWLIAFVLYKPAAAIVYATAFSLSGSDVFGQGSLANVVTGLALMVLALLALPALQRFVTPMVNATAGGSGHAALAAGALGLTATGAAHGQGRTGGAPAGGGGPSGSPGPTGSSGTGGPPGPSGGSGPAGAGRLAGAAVGGGAAQISWQAAAAARNGAAGAVDASSGGGERDGDR